MLTPLKDPRKAVDAGRLVEAIREHLPNAVLVGGGGWEEQGAVGLLGWLWVSVQFRLQL